MQLLQYQLPTNPLKLLDDYLSSISSESNAQSSAEADTNNPDSAQHDTAAISSSSASFQSPAKHSEQAEQLHNSVLRVAAELFGNNIALLENSLALLEEQEQFQNIPNDDEDSNNINNYSPSSAIIPPIRTIRARRSGRVAVLVRKQRKKSSRASNQNHQSSDKEIIDDYYLCLLGRDRVTIDNNAFKTSKGTYLCTPQHRIGMNCTCRSFFHNLKGSGSSSSGGGRFKSSSGGERSPAGMKTSSQSSNNSVVCKHLLAVILMPHLLPWRSQGVEEDVVDDKLFTKLVMRASIG
eukprot:CAMPEP_0201719010 /NCGR_PEP_ID=MMETSP0593-20130828/4361_1 /ASSEMBLY_ACC=CAM_ASM_000672 /TAXON_ID=267983 /ORGANISM="Skeletonema japonicum, Strain CCMP2506" /LENGTH=293 /DNA_ID=CAMNT_0048209399 /DNA_START=222 /DNA_END=1103 /DNA_ORIENTATION=-